MQPYLFTAVSLLCFFCNTQNNHAMKRPPTTQISKEDDSEESCVSDKMPPLSLVANETLNEWRKLTISTNFRKAIDCIAQGNDAFILTDDGWFVDPEINCMISIFSYVTTVILDNYDIPLTYIEQLTTSLGNNTTVTVLSLKNTNIGDAGAADISDMLRHNSTMQTLCLSHNHIGYIGATLICDDGIQSNISSALTFLDLEYNQIGSSNVSAIHSILTVSKPHLKIHLEHNESRTTARDCRFMSCIPTLEI